MAEENKNQLIPLVETLMKKNKETIEKVQAEQFVEMQSNKDEMLEAIDKQGETVKGLQKNIDVLETKLQKASLSEGVTVQDRILNHLKGEKFQEMVAGKKDGKPVDFAFTTSMETNAAGVILDPTNFVAGNAPVVLPFREMGVDKPPVRPVLVSDLIMWGTTTSNMVSWIERTAKTEGAAVRAEGGTMGQGDLTFTERDTKVKIMSEYMKVTNESLKDADFLASEINSELLSDLRILVDNQILSGAGTGNELSGIITDATAWAAGTFATALTDPNYADVLRVGINQILVAGKGRWMPNYILMHPTDVATLDMRKITDGRYIEIPFYNADGPTVAKVPIIQSTGMTIDKFLIGDFTKAKAFTRDELTIRVFDQNEDDAINNRSTITANIRLAFRIREQEKAAFVYGDLSDAVTALTAP